MGVPPITPVNESDEEATEKEIRQKRKKLNFRFILSSSSPDEIVKRWLPCCDSQPDVVVLTPHEDEDLKTAEQYLLHHWKFRYEKEVCCEFFHISGGSGHFLVHEALLFKAKKDKTNTDKKDDDMWCRVEMQAETKGKDVTILLTAGIKGGGVGSTQDGVKMSKFQRKVSLKVILDAIDNAMNGFGEYMLLKNNCRHFVSNLVEYIKRHSRDNAPMGA